MHLLVLLPLFPSVAHLRCSTYLCFDDDVWVDISSTGTSTHFGFVCVRNGFELAMDVNSWSTSEWLKNSTVIEVVFHPKKFSVVAYYAMTTELRTVSRLLSLLRPIHLPNPLRGQLIGLRHHAPLHRPLTIHFSTKGSIYAY
jgi:hypothetical protein